MKRQQLREWIIAQGRVSRAELDDGTPLLEERLITSLQLVELILFLESLRGRPIEEAHLVPGSFRDVETIARNFLEA